MANPNSHIHQQRVTKWIVFSFSCPGIWRIAQLYKQFVKKRFLRSGKSPTIHCMSGFQRGLCFLFLSWIWRCLGQSRWSSIGSVNGNHVNSCQAIFGTSSISGSRKEMFSFSVLGFGGSHHSYNIFQECTTLHSGANRVLISVKGNLQMSSFRHWTPHWHIIYQRFPKVIVFLLLFRVGGSHHLYKQFVRNPVPFRQIADYWPAV